MSSSDIAVSVRGVSKAYTIAHNEEKHSTLAETVLARMKNPFKRANRETFWALRDVSFDIKKGDVVGIIGRNGAGKSTLLKILSRITGPTKGEIDIYGRVGSLLEVGTGFHPELTGRENIFLNGAILGMNKAEIRKQFDAIVDFAGIEQFLDTPVKRYSSGMYVRLAFAVAAHLNSEILIVDEVLAVGDAEFQKKCLGKMKDVSSHGRTVLFVSHAMQAVSTLTNHCIWLQKGQKAAQGPTASVINDYLRAGEAVGSTYTNRASVNTPKVTLARVLTSEPNGVHIHGKPLAIEIEITTPHSIHGASVSFQVVDSLQRPVLHLWSFDSERPMCRRPGTFRLFCEIPHLHLYMGRYSLTIHFMEGPGGNHFGTIEQICPFEVTMFGRHREFEWQNGTCAYVEDSNWSVMELSNGTATAEENYAALSRR
jgi:lipopolysaccharide transport system ATP-binding protein